MRALRKGAGEGVSAEAEEGITDCSGEIAGEACSPVIEAVGSGDSCASATETKMADRSAKLTVVVMSSEAETSRTFSKNIERFLDFARNDKWPRCNIATLRLAKDCRAIRSRTKIRHRQHF